MGASSSDGAYTLDALNSSAAGKEAFFARKLQENASKSDALPPSRGGKYVGFGSTPSAPPSGGSGGGAQLLDETWQSVTAGLSRLTVAASNVASATVATVKPGLQEVSQRYARGELAESASSLLSTGAGLGLKGISSLKGLIQTAVSQIDGQQSQPQEEASRREPAAAEGKPPLLRHTPPQQQPAQRRAAEAGGWNGWQEEEEDASLGDRSPQARGERAAGKKDKDWSGWDAEKPGGEAQHGGGLSDDVWDADWGK